MKGESVKWEKSEKENPDWSIEKQKDKEYGKVWETLRDMVTSYVWVIEIPEGDGKKNSTEAVSHWEFIEDIHWDTGWEFSKMDGNHQGAN